MLRGEDDPKGKSRRQGRQSRTPGTVRQVLLNCVKPTQELILGDLNVKDVNAAISLARDRIGWKKVKALESLLAPLAE